MFDTSNNIEDIVDSLLNKYVKECNKKEKYKHHIIFTFYNDEKIKSYNIYNKIKPIYWKYAPNGQVEILNNSFTNFNEYTSYYETVDSIFENLLKIYGQNDDLFSYKNKLENLYISK